MNKKQKLFNGMAAVVTNTTLKSAWALILIITLSVMALSCDDGKDDDPPVIDNPKPQSQTITFGTNLSTTVTGHMTNAQWGNVISKLTTALNAAAADSGNLGTNTTGTFTNGVNIDLVKTTEYSYYKADFTNKKIFLNSDYVIGATQADLSAKVGSAINVISNSQMPQQQ